MADPRTPTRVEDKNPPARQEPAGINASADIQKDAPEAAVEIPDIEVTKTEPVPATQEPADTAEELTLTIGDPALEHAEFAALESDDTELNQAEIDFLRTQQGVYGQGAEGQRYRLNLAQQGIVKGNNNPLAQAGDAEEHKKDEEKAAALSAQLVANSAIAHELESINKDIDAIRTNIEKASQTAAKIGSDIDALAVEADALQAYVTQTRPQLQQAVADANAAFDTLTEENFALNRSPYGASLLLSATEKSPVFQDTDGNYYTMTMRGPGSWDQERVTDPKELTLIREAKRNGVPFINKTELKAAYDNRTLAERNLQRADYESEQKTQELETKAEDIRGEIKNLDDEISDLEKQKQDVQERLKKYGTSIHAAGPDRDKAARELSNIESQINNLRTQKSAQEAKLNPVEEQIARTKEALEGGLTEAEMLQLQSDEEALNKTLTAQDKIIEDLKAQKLAAETELQNILDEREVRRAALSPEDRVEYDKVYSQTLAAGGRSVAPSGSTENLTAADLVKVFNDSGKGTGLHSVDNSWHFAAEADASKVAMQQYEIESLSSKIENNFAPVSSSPDTAQVAFKESATPAQAEEKLRNSFWDRATNQVRNLAENLMSFPKDKNGETSGGINPPTEELAANEAATGVNTPKT